MTSSVPAFNALLGYRRRAAHQRRDRDQRAGVVQRFGLDASDFAERHKLVISELELGRVSLDEYLDQTVFFRPREFDRDEFWSAIHDQSQPNAEVLALARRLGQKPDVCS